MMMRNVFIGFICTVLAFSCVTKANAQSEEAFIKNCATQAGDDATYLKDFPVELGESDPDGRPQVAKFSMVLSKDTQYRFSICNSDAKPGKGIIQLFDTDRILGSTYNAASGKDYSAFDFKCQKTGVYHIFISFQEGKAGYAVGVLSFVKKL